MSTVRVFITGLGTISPAGSGMESLRKAISDNKSFLTPLRLFEPGTDSTMPAGQVADLKHGSLPRTHLLAIHAAKLAMGKEPPPDSIFLGCTTGGLALTEELLSSGQNDPALFSMHGTGTVASSIATALACDGPVFTVSTACSSSAMAIGLAVCALRSGQYTRVLAGGADSLCQLTYFGFHMLQLVDPKGARPLDAHRAGMSVSEGAAMLMLQAADKPPAGALGEILGFGMSCDAYHPTAPHPQGAGAYAAMSDALDKALMDPGDIDYINLHGTGTPDNDSSEAKAVLSLFDKKAPAVSSTKGIFGHSLAACGAIEASLAIACIDQQTIPPNVGCTEPDPALGIVPILMPKKTKIETVLSNSFGFGGNNATLILAHPLRKPNGQPDKLHYWAPWLGVHACDCVTGAGFIQQTQKKTAAGKPCFGILPEAELTSGLAPRSIRRIKRLSKIALSVGSKLVDESGKQKIHQVHFGTGWGPMSETYNFLTRLFADPGKLSSPTDFVGSVHNAPAGQLAIKYKATGPSATATDTELAFEQALYMAQLLAKSGKNTLLLAADEYHKALSPIFEPHMPGRPSDGGAGFVLSSVASGLVRLRAIHLGKTDSVQSIALRMNQALGNNGAEPKYALLMLRIQHNLLNHADDIMALLRGLYPGVTILEYQSILGSFATVSACATALAINWIEKGEAAIASAPGRVDLHGKAVLLLNLGEYSAAVEVSP